LPALGHEVKPSRIFLDADGKPHLMDFALAKRDAGALIEGEPAELNQ
jgi:hypothetical protein